MLRMPRQRVRRDKLSCLAMAFKADRQLGKENTALVSFTNTLSLENPRTAESCHEVIRYVEVRRLLLVRDTNSQPAFSNLALPDDFVVREKLEDADSQRRRPHQKISGRSVHRRKLKHQNIASAISFGVNATGNPFMVYEYLTGITLKERLADDRPFDAKSVAEALGISRPDMDLLHDFRLNTLQ